MAKMLRRLVNAAADKLIKDVRYILLGDTLKAVVQTTCAAFRVKACLDGQEYADAFNDEEPFDRNTHVFLFPAAKLTKGKAYSVTMRPLLPHTAAVRVRLCYGGQTEDKATLMEEYDNKLLEKSRDSEEVAKGVQYTHILYENKNGQPVHAFVTQFSPSNAALYIGTPFDGYKSKRVRATIPDMINDAVRHRHKVIAAVNADFFDMFGDGHPSGLCVKNGRVIANAQSTRPFIGLTEDGRHVITTAGESPGILSVLLQAAAGLQLVLRNGEIHDFAPLEPFSYTPHPRTCVGIRQDGAVLLLVVDGRIPEYSNGATLVDLARLMQSYGAHTALNMDGGGSSAMYTKQKDGFVLRSRPADLIHPRAGLIRKDYNALLVIEKS